MCKKSVLISVLLTMLLLGSTVVQARLLLYEPFDYTLGEKLDGQTPPAGLGMTGSWTAWDHKDFGMSIVDGPRVTPTWLTWDGIAHNVTQTGNFISVGADGRAHVIGYITLASTVTDTFVDGSNHVDELCKRPGGRSLGLLAHAVHRCR